MSIVIIGGHERMETQYKQICKQYKCKAKVFTKMKTDLKNKIGSPDLLILFTSTVSHKMVHCAVAEAELLTLGLTVTFFVRNRKKYHYA